MEKGTVARELVRRFREDTPGAPFTRVKHKGDFWWLISNGTEGSSERSIVSRCSEREDVVEKKDESALSVALSIESSGTLDLQPLEHIGSASVLGENFSLDPQLNECREKIMSDCERILRELGGVGTDDGSNALINPLCAEKVSVSPLSMSEDFYWMLRSGETQRSQGRESVYSEGSNDTSIHVYEVRVQDRPSDIHDSTSTGTGVGVRTGEDNRSQGACGVRSEDLASIMHGSLRTGTGAGEENRPQGGVNCSEETGEALPVSQAREETESSVFFISPTSSIRSADFSRQGDLFADRDCADPGKRPASGPRSEVPKTVGLANTSQSMETPHPHTETHQACELYVQDVASLCGGGDGVCVASTDWARMPLDLEFVGPFLSDDVVSDLWARLQIVKKEIHVCRFPCN